MALSGLNLRHKWTNTVPPEYYGNDVIETVTIARYWKNLNPSNGVYDWADMTTDLNNIIGAGKRVSFQIGAGDNTPEWVYTDLGVTKLTFQEYQGNDTTLSTFYQPIFWETAYKTAWKGFITAFAAFLNTNATWYNAMTHIAISGINRTTVEYRICSQNTTADGGTDAPAIWLANLYTYTKIDDTFNEFASHFSTTFPDKDLTHAMVTNGGYTPFPDVGDGQDMNNNSMDKLVLLGLQSRSYTVFTYMTDNYNQVAFQSYSASVGLQQAGQLAENIYNNYTVSIERFNGAMDKGLEYNFKFMEIFIPNLYFSTLAFYQSQYTSAAPLTASSTMVHFDSQDCLNGFVQRAGALATQIGFKWVKSRELGSERQNEYLNKLEYLQLMIPAMCSIEFGSTTNILTDEQVDKCYEDIIAMGNLCDTYNLLNDSIS